LTRHYPRSAVVPYTTLFRSPRTPSAAPSDLASTTNAEPLALDANHLSPLSRQASPSRDAVDSSAPRSEPPDRSVSSCAASPDISDRKSTRLNSSHVKISYAA